MGVQIEQVVPGILQEALVSGLLYITLSPRTNLPKNLISILGIHMIQKH